MPEEPWSIGRLLSWTSQYFADRKIDAPRVSAERLLAHVLGCQRIELYTRIAHVPAAERLAAFRALVKRRAAQEPLEYLTGRAGFMGLEFVVDQRVLIPRPETELLVELTLDTVKAGRRERSLFDAVEPGPPAASATPDREPVIEPVEEAQEPPAEAAGGPAACAAGLGEAASAAPEPGPIVVDLCTGSGCVGLSVAHYLKDAVVHACDVSPDALAVAGDNRRRLKLEDRVHLYPGDLFAAFLLEGRPPEWFGRVDFILANPPYIPQGEVAKLDANVRDYEPLQALAAGADGLDVHRRIAADAPPWLAAGGHLAVETAFDQAPRVAELFEQTGRLADVRIVRDHQGHGRVVFARRSS